MSVYEPGTILIVNMGFYQHLGIASDRFSTGNQLVISNSARAGGVTEEPLHQFSGGREISAQGVNGQINIAAVLRRARSKIGSKYNLFNWNCDQFVRWAYGMKPESPQLQKAGLLLACIAGGYVGYKLIKR